MGYGVHGEKIEFRVPDGQGGGKRVLIRKDVAQKVQSRVKTHEGELLQGKEGRDYMDRHSKRHLGTDLQGIYKKDL